MYKMEAKEKITEEGKEVVKAERKNLFSLGDGKNVIVYIIGNPDRPISGRVTAPEQSNEIMLFTEGNKCAVIPQSSVTKMSWDAEEEEVGD